MMVIYIDTSYAALKQRIDIDTKQMMNVMTTDHIIVIVVQPIL